MLKYLFKDRILYVLLSIALAIGSFNPFVKSVNEETTGSIIMSVLCLLILIFSLFSGDLFKAILAQRINFTCLLLVVVLLYVSSFIYSLEGYTSVFFNFKFLVAVLLFCLLSYIYSKDSDLLFTCLFYYTVTLSVLIILVQFGFIGNAYIIDKGRLILFGENPNSYSTRVVLAIFVSIYFLYENPLQMSKIRFILALFLPSLVYVVILSGSRGSVIMLFLGLVLQSIFSPFKMHVKIGIIFAAIVVIAFAFFKITNDIELYNRLVVSVLEGQTAGRGEIWADAYQVIQDNFIIGVGEEGYHKEMIQRFNESRDTHNVFIYILCCGGILSLLPFVAFFLRIFKDSLLVRKRTIFPLTIVCALLFLVSKTGGVLTYMILWYFLASSLAISKTLKYKELK